MPMRVLFIVLCAVLINACASTKEKSCIEIGGSWERVCFAQNYYCVMPYPDAGESCNASSQCAGECIAVKDIDGPIQGQCSSDNNPCGCWEFFENGKEAGGLCSD